MNDSDRVLYLIASRLQGAINEANALAPRDIDRAKVKRVKNPFNFFPSKPEDYYEEDGIPIMLIPLEKVRCEILELLCDEDDVRN